MPLMSGICISRNNTSTCFFRSTSSDLSALEKDPSSDRSGTFLIKAPSSSRAKGSSSMTTQRIISAEELNQFDRSHRCRSLQECVYPDNSDLISFSHYLTQSPILICSEYSY